jgi:hypothetical protein
MSPIKRRATRDEISGASCGNTDERTNSRDGGVFVSGADDCRTPDSDFRTPGSTFAGVYIRGVVTQTANVSVVACVCTSNNGVFQ